MKFALLRVALLLPLSALAGWPVEASGPVAGTMSSPARSQPVELVRTRLDYSTSRVELRIQLPPLEDAEVPQPAAGGPLPIGVHRDLPEDFRGDMVPNIPWLIVDQGALLTSIVLSSPAAVSMRLGFLAEHAGGAEFRFFDPTRPGRRYPATTGDDIVRDESGEPEVLWSPTVDGEAIGVEVMLPSIDALRRFKLTLAKVAHRYRGVSPPDPLPNSVQCDNDHVDVQCAIENIPRGQQDAVGLVEFEYQGQSGTCSGTLVSNRHPSPSASQPLFLTANHCIATGPVARTGQVRWFYQRRSCGSSYVDGRDQTTYGRADLLATSEAQDSTLLLLRGGVPQGVSLSGWSAETVAHPTVVHNISHPAGTAKRYALGETRRTTDNGDFGLKDGLEVVWSLGATEVGSSGSGLFHDQHLIGVLSGGSDTCGPGSTDYFGSFADFYPKVSRWLNPSAGAPLGDFDGDGRADVLLRHARTGRWHYFPMHGRRIRPGQGELPLSRDRAWSVAGIGDFNGDGAADVLLRHEEGRWSYYPMDGRRVLAGSGGANLTPEPAWQVAGIGDLDGDGRDDVLLRHAETGRWHYYPMNGRRALSGRGRASLTPNPAWQVAGIGDFDGDGRDDVLLRHARNGRWYYYPMNGRQTLAGRGGVPLTSSLDWSVAGTGDFDGDGADDVLLRHVETGRWHYYPMNGREVLAGRGAANLTQNTTIAVAGAGDMNGDGRADLLMRRANGGWYYYPLNGRRSSSGRGGAELPDDLNWSVAGPR